MIEITIPMRPRGKKNSRPIFLNKKTKRPFLGKDSGQHAYEKQMICHFLEVVNKTKDLPLRGKIRAEYFLFFNKKSRSDLDNVIAMINDCAQSSGLIENDKDVKLISRAEIFENTGEEKIICRFGLIGVEKSESKKLSDLAALFRKT